MNQPRHNSLISFGKALNKLKEFLDEPVVNDRDKAGIIQAFEFCFELSWKTLQKRMVAHNKTVGSPRQAFQAAFELGWISDDVNSEGVDAWSLLVDDRNLTSHAYEEEVANAVLKRVREQHYPRLKKLYDQLSAVV